jgi:hydroxyethylthiazole kinase
MDATACTSNPNFNVMTCDGVAAIRRQSPVILSLTNYVAMDFTANALLALGASPIMAHADEELEDLVQLSSSLVINIGTLDSDWIRRMHLAAKFANQWGKPVVLDPVGAGASKFRTRVAQELLHCHEIAVLRANASETAAVLRGTFGTKGVDSTLESESVVALAMESAKGSVCSISGGVDCIVDGTTVGRVFNGHPRMAGITAMGCTASALTAAFLSINPSRFMAAMQTMAVMGVCGEVADKASHGAGSFRVAFLDALSQFDFNAAGRIRVALP